jgi:hypothetical protein
MSDAPAAGATSDACCRDGAPAPLSRVHRLTHHQGQEPESDAPCLSEVDLARLPKPTVPVPLVQ